MAAADLEALLDLWRRTAPLDLDRPRGTAGEGASAEGLHDGRGGFSLLTCLADPAPIDASVHDELVERADFPDGVATYATCAADSRDPQRSLLPLLLERLDPVSRRLLWHRYLREHPLTPLQIKRVMGLAVEEQKRLEAEALAVLRKAARELAA